MRHSLLYNNILSGHQLKKVTAIIKKKLQVQKDLQTTKQHVLSILDKRTQSLNKVFTMINFVTFAIPVEGCKVNCRQASVVEMKRNTFSF